jgi:hypothetical protein
MTRPLILALACVLVAEPVAADDGAALDLARICVGEAGWQTDSGDCAAIVHLLTRRAGRLGLSVRTMARAYSPRHTGQRPSRRPWIAQLDPSGVQPAAWPDGPSWERHRPLWLEVQAHVRAVLAGEVEDPCAGEPDHWGARYGADLRRARAAGWREVDCGGTANAFWSLR